MDVFSFFTGSDFDYFNYIILPLLIFCARIVDVSIGTLRIIFVSRSMRGLATMLGFVESLVWLIAVGQIVQNLTNVWNYLAFAGGFAAGNYIGIYIESKLAIGILAVRVITQKSAEELIAFLHDSQFGLTHVSASGKKGKVSLLLCIVKRRQLPELLEIVEKYNPNAFISVEDIRSVKENIPGKYPIVAPQEVPIQPVSVRK